MLAPSAQPASAIKPGDTVWAVRLNPGSNQEHWTSFTIADLLGRPGISGSVHAIDKKTNPPICVKLYNTALLEKLRQDKRYSERIVVLAIHSAELHQQLPFILWPRRLIFSTRKPTDPDNIRYALRGFSMARLIGTTSLTDLTHKPNTRIRITPHDTAHIAITLAGQLARMHAHPCRFIFGDMSPNNIHVTRDFSKVLFIDTDAYRFDYNNGFYDFPITGLTPSYKSPDSMADPDNGRLPPSHDDFVLAILIFKLLLAQLGFTTVHPFSSGEHKEDNLIRQRHFPYDNPTQYPLPPALLAAYKSLPDEVRATFSRAFTSSTPPTATEWVKVLTTYRRCLQ